MASANSPRLSRLLAAIIALAILLAPAIGHAQLVDDVLRTIDEICARLSQAKTLEELRERAGMVALMAQNLRGGMSPLLDVDADIKSSEDKIKTLRARQDAIDKEVADLRSQAKASGTLDSDIAWRTDKMLEVQAARLALQTGGNGQLGLDEIDRRLARIAADRFETNDERAAARAEQPALEATRASLMARKADLASEFATHQNERARLMAERDKLNPSLAKIEALEKERDSNAREIEKAQEKLSELRQTADKIRLTASALAVGMDDIKACAARREKELKDAAAKPPDTPKAPTARPSFAMAGTWSGRCAGFNEALSGPFSMSAANGAIHGTFSGQYVSGNISGTVSPQGQLAAGGGNGSNLTVQWSGKIVESGGKWSGSGSWTGNSGGDACSGAWQSR